LPSPTTYVSEQAVVAGVLAGWTLCPIQWPGMQYKRPPSSGDPANPAKYIAYETDYTSAQQITFDGDEQVDGRLRFGIWVESETGEEADPASRALWDALRDLFIGPYGVPVAQPIAGVLNVRSAVPGAVAVEGTWYGRTMEFPFIRFSRP
jgi:hypothetical protein